MAGVTPTDRVRSIAEQLRKAPGRIATTDQLIHELIGRVLETRHLAASNDVALIAQRDLLHRLLDRRETEAAADTEELKASLTVLLRALDAPQLDEAFATTIQTVDQVDDLAPGLTILIATWNHATRLDRAIEGACAATDAARVIVLDDASSDSTSAVLARRAEPIRVITAASKVGLTRARNVLLRAATTRHAVFLDADNELDPAAIRQLVGIAEEWNAAAVHGVLLQVDSEGNADHVLGSQAINGEYFTLRHNVVDTLAVLDVDAVRRVGGYTLDPALESCEDWDMWHRLATAGGLLVHAPVVTARKLRVSQGHNSQPQDHAGQFARIDRTYRFDRRLDDTSVASAVIHPAIGPLWASAAAPRIHPGLRTALPEVHHDALLPAPEPTQPNRQTILVVGSAGVRNLGDDVTTIECVRRVAATVGDDVAIEVVTDGRRPLSGLSPAVWIGTLADHANRPLDHHVAVVFSGGGTITDEFPLQTEQRRMIASMAARSSVPILATGQGLGPIDRTRPAAEAIIGGAVAVSCRDPESGQLARRLGATDVEVVGDDAAAFGPPSRDQLPRRLQALPERGWIAFNGRLAGYSDVDEAELAAWADAVDDAAQAMALPVVAVALNRQPPTELETMNRLRALPRRAAWLAVDCTDEPDAARAVFGLAAGAVVRSFHAAWFAVEGGTPAVFPTGGAYYAGKSAGLGALASLDDTFHDASVPADGAVLRARWAAVAGTSASLPLDGTDVRATAWMRTQLETIGVTTR